MLLFLYYSIWIASSANCYPGECVCVLLQSPAILSAAVLPVAWRQDGLSQGGDGAEDAEELDPGAAGRTGSETQRSEEQRTAGALSRRARCSILKERTFKPEIALVVSRTNMAPTWVRSTFHHHAEGFHASGKPFHHLQCFQPDDSIATVSQQGDTRSSGKLRQGETPPQLEPGCAFILKVSIQACAGDLEPTNPNLKTSPQMVNDTVYSSTAATFKEYKSYKNTSETPQRTSSLSTIYKIS